MNAYPFKQSIVIATLLLVTVISAPDAYAEIRLAARYIDTLNGFSLRPPIGMERRKQYSSSQLVSWLRRNEKSGAIDMTLAVLKCSESKTEIDLGPYSKNLSAKLSSEDKFDVKSVKLIKVAGKDAIDLRGFSRDKAFWQRQVWIWAHPGQFLVLVIAGPQNAETQLDAACQVVLETIEIFDPTAAIEQRKANLQRGEKLLKGLTNKKLEAVFNGERRWYLLRMNDEDVGYILISASAANRKGAQGYEVQSLVKLWLADSAPREIQRSQFSTTDRNVEHWRENMIVGSGQHVTKSVEIGFKQKDLILCSLHVDGEDRPRKRNKRLTSVTMGIYLPRGFTMVLPQLVDLTKGGTYAFATYISPANDFDMRTFRVIGPEKLTLADREIDAIRATDQAAADAEPAQLWLDQKGILLKMVSADGLIMESSTQAAVVRRFKAKEDSVKTK